MNQIVKDVGENIEERGYYPGDISREALIVRQIAKLGEELGELAGEVSVTGSHLIKSSINVDAMISIVNSGREYREAFDNLDGWSGFLIDRDRMDSFKKELADLQVVVLSMAYLMDFDVLEAALKKSRDDIGRSVR